MGGCFNELLMALCSSVNSENEPLNFFVFLSNSFIVRRSLAPAIVGSSIVKSPTQAHRDARKINTTLNLARDNAGKTGDLAVAAGRVIQHRMALGTKALMNPAAADHTEFSRMIPEKIGAFSEAGSVWLRWSGAIAEQVTVYVRREVAAAEEAVSALAACNSSAGRIVLQQKMATAWLERMFSQSLALGAMMMRSQGATMAPVLRTAEANARRLTR